MRAPLQLVGRDAEVAALRDAVATRRLVTVWGPAGVGKTRLVREVLSATAVECALGPARAAHAVLQVVARALDAAPTATAVPAAVARALARARRPVVLDGADSAREALGELVPGWLAAGEDNKLVITSQSPLGLTDEHGLEVRPLGRDDAAALWLAATERLGHSSDHATAEQIVEELDRLPLAIEWYASRAALMGDEACLAQLRHADHADDPLRTALEPTLEGLSESELEALAQVCVFARGAPAAALEALVGPDLGVVDRLAGRALVRRARVDDTAPRVTAYRAVAQRMADRAREARTWEELTRAHARTVLDLVRSATPGPPGACRNAEPDRQVLRAERLELETIVERFATTDPALALEACLAFCPEALHDGTAATTADRLRCLVSQSPAPPAEAWLALGRLARQLGQLEQARQDLDRARRVGDAFAVTLELAHLDRMTSQSTAALAGYEAALAIARDRGDAVLESIGMGEMGRMLQSLGRYDEARRQHERAIALQRSMGLTRREALERSLHARATHRAGEVRAAIPMHEQALALHEDQGERRLAAAERGHLGFCLHELDQTEAAEQSFRRSIAGLADVGDIVLESIERTLLARLLSDEERFAEAQLELAIAAAIIGKADGPRLVLTRRFVAGLVEVAQDKLDAARDHWRAAVALGVHVEVGFEALLPAHLAVVEALLGDPDAAATHLATSSAVLERMEMPGLRAALAVLTAAARGTPLPDVPGEVVATSSDTRRALRLARRRGIDRSFQLAPDGRCLRLPGGEAVDLGRRAAPRRLALALVRARVDRPGVALGHDELIDAGWPGERMGVEAARKRLRTAIWTLRRLGLEPALLTRDEGYLLDPLVPVEWSDDAGD